MKYAYLYLLWKHVIASYFISQLDQDLKYSGAIHIYISRALLVQFLTLSHHKIQFWPQRSHCGHFTKYTFATSPLRKPFTSYCQSNTIFITEIKSKASNFNCNKLSFKYRAQVDTNKRRLRSLPLGSAKLPLFFHLQMLACEQNMRKPSKSQELKTRQLAEAHN